GVQTCALPISSRLRPPLRVEPCSGDRREGGRVQAKRREVHRLRPESRPARMTPEAPMIPCSNPRAQYLAHREEIDEAFRRVLEEGRYILGREVEEFEREFAAWLGAGFAVGVGSGTEALHLALRAGGVGPGDEVITVPHTAVA